MTKFLIILLVGLLLIAPISAKEITVDDKRIECGGCLSMPYFVICDYQLVEHSQVWATDEYVIDVDQYYKINIGDKVELDTDKVDITGSVDVVKILR